MSGLKFLKAKRILSAHLMHTCDIYEFDTVQRGSITKNKRVLKYKGVKCQLTQKRLSPAQESEAVSVYRTDAKLIICDDIKIRPGSEFDIFVSEGTAPKKYKNSSEPFIYPSHQEITLISIGRA